MSCDGNPNWLTIVWREPNDLRTGVGISMIKTTDGPSGWIRILNVKVEREEAAARRLPPSLRERLAVSRLTFYLLHPLVVIETVTVFES